MSPLNVLWAGAGSCLCSFRGVWRPSYPHTLSLTLQSPLSLSSSSSDPHSCPVVAGHCQCSM